MKTVLAIFLFVVASASAMARDIYGYVGFGYGISPFVPCSVRLQGPGVDRWTRTYYHPFGLFKARYYFNNVPTNRNYTITVIPDGWYRPAGASFHLPWSIWDFKAPDIWVRP